MERKVEVKNTEANSLVNVPENLPGLMRGDELVITNFPDCREYPDYAKYMKGMILTVDTPIIFALYTNADYLTYISGVSIKKSQTAMDRMRKLGYKGDFDEIEIKIFADMVEFLNKDKVEKKVEYKSYSIAIPDNKKDESVIEEMISKVDIDRLVKMISISLERGKRPKQEHVDWFLRQWALNKYEFYLAFGHKLSISTPISFQMDDNEMSSGVYGMYHTFPKYAATLDVITRKGGIKAYVNNKMPSDISLFKTYCSEVYTGGMKVSKFLSQLFQDGAFDLEFSKLLQDREVKGNINISIDPYDFLTCSQNMHGWKSCFALRGQYRAGPYSYCIDGSSLVVFRDNGKAYNYSVSMAEGEVDDFGKNAFSGNSKSWRQFCHFDKKTCAAIFSREYPSDKKIDGVREVARTLLESTISKYLGIPDEWDNYGDQKDLANKAYFGAVIYHDEGQHHYSDIAHWPSLMQRYQIQKTLIAPSGIDMSKVDIRAGHKLRCFVCGREHVHQGSVSCGRC